MKKIFILISLVFTATILNACGNKINYTEFSDNTTSTQYNKIIVNDLQNVLRQTNVLSDTTTTLFDMPGNGVNVSTNSSKIAILAENEEIYNYDYLDSNGYMYLDGVNIGQLFKHRVSDNQLSTYLLDDTAVTKSMTIRNSVYPKTDLEEILSPVNITGLYAPAGEVIKIEIDESLLNLNPRVYIGATSVSGYFNDIPSTDTYTRMPLQTKEFHLNETVNYVGSPLGGQIYIQIDADEYDVTITGGVEYMHYIHGTTDKEELSSYYDLSAPMIDIEIPDHLRINLPRSEITVYENTIFNELTKDLDLNDVTESNYREEAKDIVLDSIIELCDTWKIYCELSDYLCPSDLFRSNIITFFYDSYVVAGNNIIGNSLSTFSNTTANAIFNLENDRITLLEAYNIHFWNNELFVEQGSSTVTSKVLSIMTYMLYGNYGEFRTSVSTSVNHYYSNAGDVLNILNTSSSGTTFDVSKYVSLMHFFGVELFIEAITSDSNESNINNRLYSQFSYATNLNMEYYFETMLGWSISSSVKEEIQSKRLDMYIPCASNLQIGQVVDGNNFYNSQVYGAVDTDEININNSIVVPSGMEFEILNIGTPKGTLVNENGIYYYSATSEEVDEFVITVNVYNSEYSYTSDLLIGIAQQHTNVMINSATTTLYTSSNSIDMDNYSLDDLTYSNNFPLENSALMYNVTEGYEGVFVTYVELYLPETKEYEFTVCGIGDMRIYQGTNYKDLELKLSYYNDTSASSYNVNDSSRIFKVNATANERITLRIEIGAVVKSGQTRKRVEFYFGYIDNGIAANISADWWCGQFSSNKEVITEYYVPYNKESLYKRETSVSSYTSIHDDVTMIYQTGVLDTKFLTTPNSDKQSMDPGSIVVFRYDKEVIANFVAITSASATTGILSFFEVHVGDNGVDWTEAYNGINQNNIFNRVALNDCYTFKYVKIVFHSQYTGNYIDICNFEFQLRVDEANVFDCPNVDFSYSGFVDLVSNSNNLNNNVLEFDGAIKFSFTGTAVILFANTSMYYGVIEVKINGKTYEVDLSSRKELYSQQVFALAGLEFDTYDVEIRVLSGIANVDFIAVE